MTRQTKASLIALVMFILPLAVGGLVGKEKYKSLISGYEWLLVPYVIVLLFLFMYGQHGLTWARLQGPIWEKQTIPIIYDPKTDAERRRRVAADRPRIAAAVDRRDAEFLYKLAVEYEEEWYFNEMIEILRKVAELDASGVWATQARAKLMEHGQK